MACANQGSVREVCEFAPEAVVLIDDQNMDKAWWPGADYRVGELGKGARSVPWLRPRGWRVLAEDYQIALVRGYGQPSMSRVSPAR
jgi:hypothetical protein